MNMYQCIRTSIGRSKLIRFIRQKRSFSLNIKNDNKFLNDFAPFCSMNKYFPSSLQPLLINSTLLFILNGSMKAGIFEIIPKNEYENISIDEIVNECKLDKDITYRSLRFMSSLGFTKEIEKGYFCHTQSSLSLCKDGNAYYTLSFFFDPEFLKSNINFIDYIQNGGDGFQRRFGESFTYYLDNSESGRNNQLGMLQEIHNFSAEASLIDNCKHFDLSKYKCMVDIGGGRGHIIYDAVTKNKHLNGIVFDQENVIENAKNYWMNQENINMDKISNIRFVTGDFWDRDDMMEKCRNCDIFIMKYIIHSFSDDLCMKILKNIRETMDNDNSCDKRLLICDLVLTDDLNNCVDLPYKLMDFAVLLGPNGRERTKSEFELLFKKTGFEMIEDYPKSFGCIHIIAAKPIIDHEY